MSDPKIILGEDLTGLPLHARCQELLLAMINEDGVAPEEAVEVMFTVSLSNQIRLQGPKEMCRGLTVLLMGLLNLIPVKPDTLN